MIAITTVKSVDWFQDEEYFYVIFELIILVAFKNIVGKGIMMTLQKEM